MISWQAWQGTRFDIMGMGSVSGTVILDQVMTLSCMKSVRPRLVCLCFDSG